MDDFGGNRPLWQFVCESTSWEPPTTICFGSYWYSQLAIIPGSNLIMVFIVRDPTRPDSSGNIPRGMGKISTGELPSLDPTPSLSVSDFGENSWKGRKLPSKIIFLKDYSLQSLDERAELWHIIHYPNFVDRTSAKVGSKLKSGVNCYCWEWCL